MRIKCKLVLNLDWMCNFFAAVPLSYGGSPLFLLSDGIKDRTGVINGLTLGETVV
jgi:hypothetical protein